MDRTKTGNHRHCLAGKKDGEGFSITKSHLDLVATIPGADIKAKF